MVAAVLAGTMASRSVMMGGMMGLMIIMGTGVMGIMMRLLGTTEVVMGAEGIGVRGLGRVARGRCGVGLRGGGVVYCEG